jgi:hypothetical protein
VSENGLLLTTGSFPATDLFIILMCWQGKLFGHKETVHDLLDRTGIYCANHWREQKTAGLGPEKKNQFYTAMSLLKFDDSYVKT